MKFFIVAVLIVGSGLLFDDASGAKPAPAPAAGGSDGVCAQYAAKSSAWASGANTGWSALWKADGAKAACHGKRSIITDSQGKKAEGKLFYFSVHILIY